MSDTFDLPRDADGYVDMNAFPDDDLDPSASDELEATLQDAPAPEDLDDHWETLLERAVDPSAPAVSADLAGPADESGWDDPFADVDDGDIPNPFADLDDEPDGATADPDDPASVDAEQDDADLDPHADGSDLDGHESPFDDDIADDDIAHDDIAGDDQLDLTDDLDGVDVIAEAPVDDLDGLDALDSQLRDHGS